MNLVKKVRLNTTPLFTLFYNCLEKYQLQHSCYENTRIISEYRPSIAQF
jgi:hypothetical protein